jgi:hypothetical protein
VALTWFVGFALAGAMITRRPERLRAAGMILFLISNGSLLLLLGWARANYDDCNTFAGHYLSKGVPALCCVYLISQLYAGRRLAGEFQGWLFTLALIPCLFTIATRDHHLAIAALRMEDARNMEIAARIGKSPYYLYQHFKEFQGHQHVDPRWMVKRLEALRDLGLKPFRNLPHEETISIPMELNVPRQLLGTSGVWQAVGPSYAEFAFASPKFISAIIIKFSHEGDFNALPEFQCLWKGPQERRARYSSESGCRWTFENLRCCH